MRHSHGIRCRSAEDIAHTDSETDCCSEADCDANRDADANADCKHFVSLPAAGNLLNIEFACIFREGANVL